MLAKSSILVVVSHDYGELGYAYDFARPLADNFDVCFALPKHLYDGNRDLKFFSCIEYNSDNDIFVTYQNLKPEYVLFFTAFLLVSDKTFKIRSLRKFIETIYNDRKIAISTDPFLGITSSVKIKDINLDLMNPSGSILRHYALKYMAYRKFRDIHSILKDIPCLAPFGLARLEDESNFYPYNNSTIKNLNNQNKTPYWLFVISEIDYSLQKKVMGADKYVRYLINRLVDTSNFSVRPVLHAPMELIGRVKKVKPDFEYIHRCNVIEHKSLILNAERTFYWNMISHSIYHRVTNYKPLHFFDRGHLHDIFARVHNSAMRCYYQGAEPAIIDFSKPLNIDELNAGNEQFYSLRKSELEKLRQFPNSIELLNKLKRM